VKGLCQGLEELIGNWKVYENISKKIITGFSPFFPRILTIIIIIRILEVVDNFIIIMVFFHSSLMTVSRWTVGAGYRVLS